METKLVLVGGALLVAVVYGLRVLVAWQERRVAERAHVSPCRDGAERVPCGQKPCPYLATETVWDKRLMKPVDYCHHHATEALTRGTARILGRR
jgi:hypothetical protein